MYQGLYNPLNRAVEAELLPLLAARGVRFVAFNALAAGLLTGKHSAAPTAGGGVGRAGGQAGQGGQDVVLPGRFRDNPNYLPRFYTGANFKALSAIEAAVAIAGGGEGGGGEAEGEG